MEKKQVSTFLKILQIPTDAPPSDIKESLLASGWNVDDADEAIRVLYPSYSVDDETEAKPVTQKPQLVAQRYVKPIPEPETTPESVLEEDAPVADTEPPSFTPESVVTDETSETVPAPETPPPAPEPEVAPSAAETPPEATPAAESTEEPPSQATDEEFDFASVTKAHAVAAEQVTPTTATSSPEAEAEAEQARPHTDAPWLQEQVDIYDVTEEEKQEMIRTVYRTNERLTPQTIHALLGIDVDLSEYEAAYQQRKHNEVTGIQIAVILLSSLAIAAIALYLGLYYFEVGPFHPSITGGRE